MTHPHQLPTGTLPPCPFCGCDKIGLALYENVYMVYCGDGYCSARVLSSDIEIAKLKWSRRPAIEVKTP